MPQINYILDQLREARFVSSLDSKDGYMKIPLEETSRKLRAFTVPGKGLFQWNALWIALGIRIVTKCLGPSFWNGDVTTRHVPRRHFRYWTFSTRTQGKSPKKVVAFTGGKPANRPREVSIVQARAEAVPRRGFMVPTFRIGHRTNRQAGAAHCKGVKWEVAGPTTSDRGGKGKAYD